MLRRVALRSRARALAVTGLITLSVAAAIVLTAGTPTPAYRAGVVVVKDAANINKPDVSHALAPSAPPALSKRDAAARLASMPLYFEPNVGQSDPNVRFLSQSSRYALFLTDAGAVFSMVGGRLHKGPDFAATTYPTRKPHQDRLVESAVRIRMVGANPHPAMHALEPLPGRVNYLIGDQPSKFHRNVPTYSRVKVAGVYPGIDLVYYGMPSALEYDIVAAPGADPSRIRIAVEGGDRTVVDANGDIAIATPAGTISMHRPHAYQRAADGSETPVESSFVTAKDGARTEYAIALARYDRTRPLIIDPTVEVLFSTVQMLYSSFLGGDAESVGPVNLEQFAGLTDNSPLTVADVGTDVALDPSNDAYMTGVAYSGAASFPLKNAFQNTQTGANAAPNQNPVGFIAKFDTTKTGAASLLYSTYIGGMGDTNASDAGDGNGDLPFGIAVDGDGEAFIVGQTYSTDFPDTASCGAFGKANDQKATDVNVGFVAKLNAAGSALVYACYIDGQNNATESRVALYPAGCKSSGTLCKAYVSGTTQSDSSTGFPTTAHAFQTTLKATSGKSNATFLVVHEDGQSLDYATLYGGSGNGKNADAAASVAVDSSGHGYIAGATFSSDLTTKNPAVASYNAGASSKEVSNVFVAEFNPSAATGAASLLYATYLGGSGATGTLTFITALSIGDVATAIRIDPVTGHIWVAGATASTDFTPGKAATVFQSANAAEAAAGAGAPATAGFVAELDTTKALLNQVLYRTYFGGGGFQILGPLGGSIGVGDAIVDLETTGPLIYVTGATASGTVVDGFPLSGNACQKLNNTSGISFGGIISVPVTAFAAQLDPSQSTSAAQLVFSTLLGGTGTADAGTGLAIDGSGDMVISGLTYSGDFPVTTTAFQTTNNATGNSATNAFLTVLYPAGTDCGTGGGTPVPTAIPSATPSPAPTPGGKIAVSTGNLALPNAGVDEVPTKAIFTIQNTSAKHHLVGNVGSPSAPFSIVSGGGAFDLPPVSAPMAVKVRFAPTTLGPQAGSVVITSNDAALPSVTVNLSGAGKPGVPSLAIPLLAEPPNPLAMTFGPVGIGTASPTIVLKIHNDGLGVLGGTVGALSAPFAVTSPLAFGPLAPGGVASVRVTFTPSAAGPAAAVLAITSVDAAPAKHILDVPVSGVGKPGVLTTTLAASGETLAFGKVSHTGPAKVMSFKIENVGKGALQGDVPALGGTFSVTAGSGAFALLPGGAKKITVQFAPPSTGPFNTPLAITVTPPGKPAAGITVTLEGKGT